MLQKIKMIITEGTEFLITTHMDPDGDAIGSVLSFYWVLESLNKKPFVCIKDPIPYRYDFLPRPSAILHDFSINGCDTVFVLDCGEMSRIGEGYERLLNKGTIINIDHHNTNGLFGSINLVDETASSTAEILYDIYTSLNITFTRAMAINLYTAIFTDTGSFRYENTTARAFRICEEMIRNGVNPSYVSRMIHENHPKERFILLGLVLTTLETYANDTIAMAVVTNDMFKQTGTTREHTDGFVEYLREIKGVEIAVLIREVNNTRYKISMRSKGMADVAHVCNRFGGGGHKNAAGCHIDGNLSVVKQRLKEALAIG